ncbi:MAG: SRPBCC family protein [bacterium]|nr:SRPBCC family protein [bacterium]
MYSLPDFGFDPQLDLRLERDLDLPVGLVWKAWTEPEHLIHWFTPDPWRTTDAQIDLRPGGKFQTTMCSPEGEENTETGCFLEVLVQQRLVWTTALLPGYRPSNNPFMTAILTFKDLGQSTHFTALVRHWDSKTREEHEKMGFAQGWSAATDQLVAHMKGQR